jgi:hypothetical protein
MARPADLGTTHICCRHGLRVVPGTGAAPLVHTGGNAGRPCDSQVYVVTERREVSRAEVLTALAGEETGDGGHPV